MTTIDPTTNIGKIRLRIADYSDLPYLNDSTIQATLDDNGGNLPQTAKVCATYILGMLAHKTHRRLNQMEVWQGESFKNYLSFLLLTVKDPAFCSTAPIPYAATVEFNDIIDFQNNWNRSYYNGTSAQSLARIADLSPNDNSRIGGYWGGF